MPELSAFDDVARNVGVDDVMRYFAYPQGRQVVAESKVVRSVEDWDDDGVWCVFVYLASGARLVFRPDEAVVVYRLS